MLEKFRRPDLNVFHLKWIIGTHGNWKTKILGAILALQARQLYQSSPFKPKRPKSWHNNLFLSGVLSLHITIYQVSCDAKETNKCYQNTLNPKLAYLQNSILFGWFERARSWIFKYFWCFLSHVNTKVGFFSIALTGVTMELESQKKTCPLQSVFHLKRIELHNT